MNNPDKRVIIIKDVNLEYMYTNDVTIAHFLKYIERAEDNCSIGVYSIKEPINLHKFVCRRNEETQEYIFGITNEAAKKFPILQLTKDLSEQNDMLLKQNSALYKKIDDLTTKNKINEFTLKYLRNNKFVKILNFLKLIRLKGV